MVGADFRGALELVVGMLAVGMGYRVSVIACEV